MAFRTNKPRFFSKSPQKSIKNRQILRNFSKKRFHNTFIFVLTPYFGIVVFFDIFFA